MKTESKHTPGPWRTNGDNICAIWEDGQEVSLCVMEHTRWCGKDVNGPEAKRIASETPANARLIVAAPELLEALELCADKLAMWPEGMNPEFFPSLKSARAAIAKAKGQL